MRTRVSVRTPSFFGPFALAAGLLSVCVFSEPFWQNFFIIESSSATYTMKAGVWGICTRLTTQGSFFPFKHCSSYTAGYALNLRVNSTGPTEWAFAPNDAILFGQVATPGTTSVPVFSSMATTALWLHPVAAILAVLTVASLIISPADLPPRLSKLQKGGMVTMGMAVLSFIVVWVLFAVEMSIIVPALARLNAVPGIRAAWGPVPWFVLPSALVMIPAFLAVLMKANQQESSDFHELDQDPNSLNNPDRK